MTDSDAAFASDEEALAHAVHTVYGAAPEAFVATRKEWVTRLREAGRREVAKEVGALRKPSVAAAAVNALVRADDSVVRTLHEVGARMRQAQSALDVTAMAALRGERDALLSDWVSAARRHAPGGALTAGVEAEVRDTAVAALADAAATEVVASGNLTRALSYSGFGEVDVADAVARTSTGVVLTRIEGGLQDGGDRPPAVDGVSDEDDVEPVEDDAEPVEADEEPDDDLDDGDDEPGRELDDDAEDEPGAQPDDADEPPEAGHPDAELHDDAEEEPGGGPPRSEDDPGSAPRDVEEAPDGEPDEAHPAEGASSTQASERTASTSRQSPGRSTSTGRRTPTRRGAADRVAELEMELDEAEKAVAAARATRKEAAAADADAEADVQVAQEQVSQAERLLKAALAHLDKAKRRRTATEEALRAADVELVTARRHRDDARATLEEAEDA